MADYRQPGKGRIFKVSQECTLLDFLYEALAPQSRNSIKNYLAKGQIAVNGRVTTTYNLPLRPSDSINVLPKAVSLHNQTLANTAAKVENAGIDIVYEDDYIIVVDKPAGLPSISTDSGSREKAPDLSRKGGKAALKHHDDSARGSVYSCLTEYVKTRARSQRKNMGIENHDTVKVWIVHRLDRDTSGLLVFAKDEKTKDWMQSRWDSIVLERKYFAICEGRLDSEEGTIRSYLYEDPSTFMVYSSPEQRNDSRLAITHYRVIAKCGHYTGVEFSLETGRKNQIRVHAAEMGHPVAGDRKYGAKTSPAARLCLHAQSLVFRHPHYDRVMKFTSPLPEKFKKLLRVSL